jgi:hypothetical protein
MTSGVWSFVELARDSAKTDGDNETSEDVEIVSKKGAAPKSNAQSTGGEPKKK